MQKAGTATRVIYRFLRDLRLDDHAGLAACAQYGEIVPVLVVDEQLIARLCISSRRAAFYCAAVAALDRSLRERGSALVVRRGDARKILPALAKETGARVVAWSNAYDKPGIASDDALQYALEEKGCRVLREHDAPAIPPEEIGLSRASEGEGYRAFVPYYERWRELAPASHELPLLVAFAREAATGERLPECAEFGSHLRDAAADSTQARARLDTFLQQDALQYGLALNVPSDDRTSHLGPDLSFGTIAARTVVRETKARLVDPFLLAEERNSLKLFLRALAMRDFFLQLSWYHPETHDEPLQEKMRGFAFLKKHPALDAWREGMTGFPLVDAGIRQLRETGWMHPRVRALAASFLCFDLGVDWRVGRAEWDRYLIEDDYALATGNWQWIAGAGADMAQYPRIYNPRRQARQFDPQGVFVRRYVPELSNVPAGKLYGTQSGDSQIELPLFSADAYPRPVVDHDRAAREFLARYTAHLRG